MDGFIFVCIIIRWNIYVCILEREGEREGERESERNKKKSICDIIGVGC